VGFHHTSSRIRYRSTRRCIHRPRRHGRTKYGMWNRVFRALADAFAVRWMQRRVLRYRIREEV